MTSNWPQSNAVTYSTDNLSSTIEQLSDSNESVKYQQIIDELKNENTHLKDEVNNFKQTEKDYNEQIHTLQLRIEELEDWNGDTFEVQNKDQSNIDLLTSRNKQLENDLQRLQLQQRNNQLAIERLDEYEETISQLQEELDQLRSNKKKQLTNNDENTNRLLIEEQKRNEAISNLLEETRLQLKQSEEKILKIETNVTEKEINIREMLERQIIELHETVQSLDDDKHELQQQLQSRDRQIQTFQASTVTPGSPSMIVSSSSEISQNDQQLNSLYDQFVTLLPSEFSSSDNTHLSLIDRFVDLFEQFSSYIGTFSIIQEELDSLRQILNEKQDELEKLRTHLELTTDKLTQLQEEQSLEHKNKSFDSDEDELEEILGIHQRAPSSQSLLSITPGEKQQLIAQNELLSSLLTEKEQELIRLQQAEKTREDLIKNFELLKRNLQQIEIEKDVKQIELNDIRNILDEKLRENSSLKKEKMFFIEKLSDFERERQEQQSIIQFPSSPDREKSPSPIKTKIIEQNTEQAITQDQYEKLHFEYNQLLELTARQHEESLSYYNEYTRIFSLYNDLNTKYSELQINYESIQSLLQQKNEAYLLCRNELNTFQNLLYEQKEKSDDIDLLRSKLNEREIKLEQLIINEKQFIIKQSELELNVKLLEEKNSKLISNQKLFEQIQLDLKRITHERDLSIVEKKQLENQMVLNQEKILKSEEHERKLTIEIERLIQSEKTLKTHNEQVLLNEFETLRNDYIKIEELNNNLNNQIKYLQNNLEQYQDSLREQISITARLTNENNEIPIKDLLINNLQLELDLQSKQLIESDRNFQTANNSRVEKQLVKNILLSYFNTPIDKQQQVIPILGALVDFTQEDYQKAINAVANNYNNTANNSWLTGWLGTNPPKTKIQTEIPNKSFAELLIQYVDQESTDTLQQPVLQINTENLSVSTTSDNPTQSSI